jgi:hypothetical protein
MMRNNLTRKMERSSDASMISDREALGFTGTPNAYESN